MSTRFEKKRVNEGRVELFDNEQREWVALALIPAADRPNLGELDAEESAPALDPMVANIEKLDASVLLGAAQSGAKPRSRASGWMLGLLFGLGVVAVLLFFSL